MRMNRATVTGLLLCLPLTGVLVSTTGCAGTRYERSTGAYVDDKALTAKVKTALFRDPDVSGFDVHVNTFRGEVQLSGFVDTSDQKIRAASVAREVPGVQMVVNNLEVKPRQENNQAVGTPGSNVQNSSRTVTQPAPETPAADLAPNPAPGRAPNGTSSGEGIGHTERVPGTTTTDRQSTDTTRLDTTRSTGAAASSPLYQAGQTLPGRHDVEINLTHGKATITGNVANDAERQDLERRVSQIPGVDTVDNKLEVRPPAPVRE